MNKAIYYEESDRLEFILEDRPVFHRHVGPYLETLIDMETGECIGWCIDNWSRFAPKF